MTLTREQIEAEPIGPRLDSWVAEHVMGWKVYDHSGYSQGERDLPHCYGPQRGLLYKFDGDCNAVFAPSRRIVDAWEVVLEMTRIGLPFKVEDSAACGWWFADFGGISSSGGHEQRQNAPLAISRAALLACLKQ